MMNKRLKQEKGITLIALIITIIVMLILAGVVLNLTIGERGIFNTAKKSGEEYEKAQLKEELELKILDIQSDKIAQGKEMIREDLEELSEIGAIVTSTGTPATGEYKDYDFTIDENYVVIIGEKVTGVKPEGTAVVTTTGNVAYGNKVEIKVTASISKGSIAGITSTNGAELKEDTSATEKTYEVAQNGTYYFTIKAENGRSIVVSVEVTNILQPTVTVSITDIKAKKFTIGVSTQNIQATITEYKYYVNGEVVHEGTTDESYTVTELTPETTYKVYVEAIAGENIASEIRDITTPVAPAEGAGTPSEGTVGSVRTGNKLPFTWEQLGEIAQIISNNYGTTEEGKINQNTAEFTLSYAGEEYTIGVGDYTWVNSKKVRIIGFNHDDLVDTSAYGEGKTNTKAGITFEYVNFIISNSAMNSSATNVGGWGSCELRGTLNGTAGDKTDGTIATLENKAQIKKVTKTYNIGNKKTTNATCEDYLWLLACSEIWNNSYWGSFPAGRCLSNEGDQYEYFKLVDADCTVSNSLLSPMSSGHWLRSPDYYNTTHYDGFTWEGYCSANKASNTFGIAPGFSI